MLRHRYLRTHLTLTVLFGGFLMLIYSPMISVFVLSFQGEGGGLTFPLRGVSLHWFRSLFVEQQLAGNIWAALQRSLILGIVVAVVTFVVAFLAGLAFRRPFRGANLLFQITVASLVTPSILVSLGIGVLFTTLGLPKGLLSSGLGAHLTWTLPVGVLVMFSAFARFDARLEEAAIDAGASGWQCAREVLVPVLAPSLAGVALLGLTLSYDEFSRSVLVMGTGNTLPLELFAMTTNITTPAIYALGTVTTVFSLAVLLAGGGAIALLRRRRIGP
jgi:putative spermidine/putrescine transport system permease protein